MNQQHKTKDLDGQLHEQRRTVDFDTYDILVQQLISMLRSKAIDIAPVYQRQFRWDAVRCSQLIESLFLGIPIPSLFMATNKDGTWELVDGVQRLSTLVKFAADEELRERLKIGDALTLDGLEKLSHFNGLSFSDLPKSMQLQFELRPVKVVTLSDKSDMIVRFDLFERLNTGGIALTSQEIRNCVFRGKFAEFIEDMAKDQNFNRIVFLTKKQNTDGTKEECVLRFFAFYSRYKQFEHSVINFLNSYMQDSTKLFDYDLGEKLFRETFLQLATVLPNGITRPNRQGVTPLILFEGVAVGAALAIQDGANIAKLGSVDWLGSEQLRTFTTGATNRTTAVRGRIEFCRDQFLGN